MRVRLFSAVLFASAAVMATNASAADLGGDCCADLEERVAELEATTARKGNRKVSLTVYGQVNTAVMFWDNGAESNVYQVDNDISSTRFGFKGKAKINSDWSAGYKIEIEAEMASSSAVTEDTDEGVNGLGIRKAEWYLKSKTYGKVTVGQGDSATSGITEIDLSGTNVIAQWDDLKFGNDIAAVDRNGVVNGNRIDSFTNDGNHEFNRINRVRYDTPTFNGFVASAAWGEDDVWDIALRYAGEFGGFKFAGGVGYGEGTDDINGGSNDNDCSDATGDIGCKIQNFYTSASLLHTPTGLFVTGGYSYRDFDDQNDPGVGAFNDYEDNHWFVRAGISQKWIPLGKTAIYGEFQQYNREGQGNNGGPAATRVAREEEADIYGFGVVQKIDSAAMELYLGYRHVEMEDNRLNAAGTLGTDYEDFDVVTTGARIKF